MGGRWKVPQAVGYMAVRDSRCIICILGASFCTHYYYIRMRMAIVQTLEDVLSELYSSHQRGLLGNYKRQIHRPRERLPTRLVCTL